MERNIHEWFFFGKDADDIDFETNYSKHGLRLTPPKSKTYPSCYMTHSIVFPENTDNPNNK